jgi:AcrR family transcriptional regulator
MVILLPVVSRAVTVFMKKEIPRRERKKAAVRERIVATGIELFSKHGIEAVTIDRIAEAADIGKGTVYNYFSTKEDIVVAFMAALEAKIQVRVRKLMKSRGPAETILTEFIQHQFDLKKPYLAFVRVFLGQMFSHTEQFLPYMAEMQKAIDPPLEEMFRGLRDRGFIRADIGMPDLIMAFKTLHLGLTGLWAVEGPPFAGTARVLQQEIRIFCRGLAPLPRR